MSSLKTPAHDQPRAETSPDRGLRAGSNPGRSESIAVPEPRATYWRSMAELTRSPELERLVEREFPGQTWEGLSPATRRQFLKVMGASVALAGATACRWPEEAIVPFARRPEDRTPGVPQRFATSLERLGVGRGLVVTSFDGRPIKAEGNPLHPDSLGALSAIDQAAVLELYDPDRSRTLIQRQGGQEVERSWEDFDRFASERFTPGSGAGVAVLSEASSSPSLFALRRRFLEALPGARWYEWEPLTRDNARDGARLAFGEPLRERLRLERARILVCFDADPGADHPAALRHARDLAAARRPESDAMCRVHVAEPSFTLTGVVADHRVPVTSAAIPSLLVAVAQRLVVSHGLVLPAAAAGLGAALAATSGAVAEAGFVARMAADIAEHRGAGLIVVGPRQAAWVHGLAHVLNLALGNLGRTLELGPDPDPERPSHLEAIQALAESLRADGVSTLLMLGGNPAFDAPADLHFGELLDQVEASIHLSLYRNETSRRCTWHLPRVHPLEEWGDCRAWDGTWTMRQPLIEPLYGGRSPLEVLAAALGAETSKGHDLVRGVFEAEAPGKSWRRALHDGLVEGTAWDAVAPEVAGDGPAAIAAGLSIATAARVADGLELVLTADAKVFDGRYANNAWLQELPDPVTKITWGNALLVAPPTAHRLGVTDGDVVEVGTGDARLELPVCVAPGQALGAVTAALGYGRSAAGVVGNGVGADAFTLRTTAALHALPGVTVRRTGCTDPLAVTQDHHAIDPLGFAARNLRVGVLVREATLAEYAADPQVIERMSHHPPLVSLWKEQRYEGEQWGMTIDLNACIGCGACVVACQAENNIPVVGREQVLRSREMHWIRVDRYFRSTPGQRPEEVERPAAVFQPVTCVQCENAPCEQVCPVAATQHTRDGLNAMVYNRCVGTRYCSNNCPYKVRRFNFFNYHKHLTELESMQHNPEVTVRSRGVMEKCTFCVQRIETARIAARNQRRPLADDEIEPACAQTCPARAITFGNLNDPQSAVSRMQADHRAYAMLAELNVKPRLLYLARLRNPVEGEGSG